MEHRAVKPMILRVQAFVHVWLHTCMCVCVCVQGILCLLFLRFRVYTLYVGHDLGKHSVLTLLMRCHNYRNDHYDQMPVNSNRTRLWMIGRLPSGWSASPGASCKSKFLSLNAASNVPGSLPGTRNNVDGDLPATVLAYTLTLNPALHGTEASFKVRGKFGWSKVRVQSWVLTSAV